MEISSTPGIAGCAARRRNRVWDGVFRGGDDKPRVAALAYAHRHIASEARPVWRRFRSRSLANPPLKSLDLADGTRRPTKRFKPLFPAARGRLGRRGRQIFTPFRLNAALTPWFWAVISEIRPRGTD